MRRLGQIAVTTTFVVLALPGLARAGTVRGEIASLEGLFYVAHPGEANHLTISGSGSRYSVHDRAGVTAGRDCTQVDPETATCRSSRDVFVSIEVWTKDGRDIVHISLDASTFVFVNGGIGDDRLFVGARNVRSSGGDSLVLVGGPGGDTLGGNPGVRPSVNYLSSTSPVSVSIDGVANDGARGEGDNVLPSIYEVDGSVFGDRFTGSAARDSSTGTRGTTRSRASAERICCSADRATTSFSAARVTTGSQADPRTTRSRGGAETML
jgi:hypothetical protein